MTKLSKAHNRFLKRQRKWIEDLNKIEFHEQGLTKWIENSQGPKIHLKAIQKILSS
ncbi:hypothetical protein V9L05_20595 [Bernardetia sp. Wsw4-3y2]|uniref:hypothetical protein n=1 Tax=Bernardetia sp. Wsw4-3y2 TaxID=3127471 RepID=UPI0030CA9016